MYEKVLYDFKQTFLNRTIFEILKNITYNLRFIVVYH